MFFYLLIFETVIDRGTYAENYIPPYSPETVKALSENVVNQVMKAEKSGNKTVDVLIPVHDSQEWPITVSYGGVCISQTLFQLGITHVKMYITLVPDISVNDEFNLS